MLISNIDLINYRNYKRFKTDLNPSKNIIIGDNGIGKTNILESIILVANTKSFRTNDDSELIKKGEESARVDVRVDNNLYRIILSKKGKALFINQSNIKKTSDFIGKINAVLFKPDDLEFFSRGPKIRRRILDLELGKISKNYLDAILLYNKLLKDKNYLLKEEDFDEVYLKTIEERMVIPIMIIIKEREAFIDYLNEHLKEYYYRLSNQKVDIKANYHKMCLASEGFIKKTINDNHKRDVFYKYATVGPHKEDFDFSFDNNEVTSYTSQGQKRLLMISFKLCLMDYIINKTNEAPILLLDDILSELDNDNKKRLLNMLPNNIQTIITATDIDNIKIDGDYRLLDLRRRDND